MFTFTIISLVLFITTAINLIGTVVSWQRKNSRSGLYLASGITAITFWTLAAGLDYAAVPVSLKVFFAKWEYTGYNAAFVFFALFSLSFAGLEDWFESKFVKLLFLFFLISNLFLPWANDWNGWLWSGFVRSEFGLNTVIFEHGPGYDYAVISGYLMIVVIIVPLVFAALRGSDIARSQARIFLGAVTVTVLGNLVYLLEPIKFKGVDWSSVTFSISGVIFLYALYGTRLLDIVPIARDKLVAALRDGMVVVDIQNRIIDANDVAARMLSTTVHELIGKNLVDVSQVFQALSVRNVTEDASTELEIGLVDKRFYDALVSPLFDGKRMLIGHLIVFRDITLLKQNQLRLLQLSQAVEQSPVSVMVTDLQGTIEYVNPHFSKLTGYSIEEVIGQNPRILQSGQTSESVYKEMWETILSRQVWQGEFLNRKKNGDMYWAQVVIAPVFSTDGQIINFVAVKDDITERKRAEQSLEQRFLEIQELNKNLQETQEQLVSQQRTLAAMEERERLARDLHDSVSQSISGMVLFAETLAATLEKNNIERAVMVMDRLQESAKQALKETRLMLYELQDSGPKRGVDLIRELDERFSLVEKRAGVRAHFVHEGEVNQLPSEWREHLYWITLEALNNSLKHAQAENVHISLRCLPEFLELKVSDDGIGFDMEKTRSGGMGMKNLKTRADIIGGELQIVSELGNGTCVLFHLDLHTD